MQKPHWMHFVANMEFVDLSEAEIGKIYVSEIAPQTDFTLASKDYPGQVTKGLTFQFFKIALYEIASKSGVAVADFF